MQQCEYVTCDAVAKHRVIYDEPGTPITETKLCTEHKNTERIHDPFNTRAKRLDIQEE